MPNDPMAGTKTSQDVADTLSDLVLAHKLDKYQWALLLLYHRLIEKGGGTDMPGIHLYPPVNPSKMYRPLLVVLEDNDAANLLCTLNETIVIALGQHPKYKVQGVFCPLTTQRMQELVDEFVAKLGAECTGGAKADAN